MDVSLCERFAKVRDYLGLTQKEFSLKISATQGNIAMIESFKREPSKQHIINIISNWDIISPRWLLTGEGEMILSYPSGQTHDLPKPVEPAEDDEFIDVPVVAEISAGVAMPGCSGSEPLSTVCVNATLLKGLKQYYCFRVNGQSMEPEIKHNDLVIIDGTNDLARLEGQIAAFRIDGDLTLKRLMTSRQTTFLVPINKSFDPQIVDFDLNHVTPIGRLKYLIRNY